MDQQKIQKHGRDGNTCTQEDYPTTKRGQKRMTKDYPTPAVFVPHPEYVQKRLVDYHTTRNSRDFEDMAQCPIACFCLEHPRMSKVIQVHMGHPWTHQKNIPVH